MIHYFKLPNDLYFWGQDRMGSLIPLIAQIPDKIFHLSPVISESVVHYLILLLGFWAFSTFLNSKFYRIVFAIVWFFPPMRLIDLTQFAFGIHYSLIAIACYLLKLSEVNRVQEKKAYYHFILLLATIVLIASVWVSDMALVTVTILLGVWLFHFVKNKKLKKPFLSNTILYYVLFGLVVGYLFIHYAKGISSKRVESIAFGDISTIKQTIIIIFTTIKNFFIFEAKEPFTSVYSYLVVIIFGYLIFNLPKVKMNETIKKWGLIFILDAAALFTIIIISKWTLLNNVPRRYFTCNYIALSFAAILIFDNLRIDKIHSKIAKIFIGITVLLAGIGTIYNLRYIWPKTLTPRITVAKEFQQLGKSGIIAEYWNSYINSCDNPDMIKATPHDKAGSIRSYSLVQEVLDQENIYVIRDMWLATFPDSLNQFGQTLLKDGTEFTLGNCDVCKYKKAGSRK